MTEAQRSNVKDFLNCWGMIFDTKLKDPSMTQEMNLEIIVIATCRLMKLAKSMGPEILNVIIEEVFGIEEAFERVN